MTQTRQKYKMVRRNGKTVLLTGSQGFIGGYLADQLLRKGYRVIGVDNYSKYGHVVRAHDKHPNFTLLNVDLSLSPPVLHNYLNIDYVIAGAAMIGGISYFHKYAYDLLATNERILANTFETAINLHKARKLRRIVVISSSMVFEGADTFYGAFYNGDWEPWPSKEEHVNVLPPPMSTYGFQKLASEYFCKGANEQYGVPYTIVRPFNCVGLGEEESLQDAEVYSGNVKLRMSHVLPDLVKKCLEGQDPLHILGVGDQVRCYTHGKDIARGIIMAMESPSGLNNDFNIASATSTTVLELAEKVWNEVHRGQKRFNYVSDEPYKYDVQRRIPDVGKAKHQLGFEAKISLDESIKEVVRHMRKEYVNNST